MILTEGVILWNQSFHEGSSLDAMSVAYIFTDIKFVFFNLFII